MRCVRWPGLPPPSLRSPLHLPAPRLAAAVVAAVSFVTDVRLARRSFVRDVVFFIGTVLYLLAVTLDGVITLAEAAGFIVIYILFVLVVGGGRWIRLLRTEDEGSSAFGSEGGEGAAVLDNHGLKPEAAAAPGGAGAFQAAAPLPAAAAADAVSSGGVASSSSPMAALDEARRAALVKSYQRAHERVKQQTFFLQSPSALAEGAC